MSGQDPDTIDILRKTSYFSDLKEDELRSAATHFKGMAFTRGSHIVREGERSDDFFFLVEGRANVTRSQGVVATLEPYQFFGELTSLGFQVSRTAGVVADTDCRCLTTTRASLEKLISSHPSVSRRLLAEFKERYKSESRTDEWWA